ncbi:MAG TPA: alkaline phosphatase D family protein [Patescibacteria group bacterium]|nr:alkaline phosphatase D family protein [Patescibacteria group bacterium]
MARLLLGPLLRHVGERDATVWVETDATCEAVVRVGTDPDGNGGTTGRASTFTVAGHHYAVVVVEGLEPASSAPYEVLLDGEVAWPEPGSPFPPSRIKTIDPDAPIRLLFGSCREPPTVRPLDRTLDPDVFVAYANRMVDQAPDQWPDLLLLVGDQVYADDTSAHVRDFIRSRRDIKRPPGAQVANFEEYTRLYYESWGEPTVRWILSTLPTSMIFDDHDVRDDWNTSDAWRRDMQRTSWWEERITGALVSYWIYQHLGNLSPAGLASDELYQKVLRLPDAEPVLREFAQAADREADGAKGAQWSYRRDFGSVRLLVIDSRCGRILTDGRRSMVSDVEFDWIERQSEDGRFDHLVVATSMPWLLPRALHDIESWNEALCAGSRGRLLARLSEKVRRAVDLEHWAAFRKSFDRLAAWFARVGGADRGEAAPATICVLSGDVHHTYVSEAAYKPRLASRVYQITCSPIHNTIPLPMRLVFKASWSHTFERFVHVFDRWAHVPPLPIRWHHPTGPHFGNILAMLVLDGRQAHLVLERAIRADEPDARTEAASEAKLVVTKELSLTEAPRPAA